MWFIIVFVALILISYKFYKEIRAYVRGVYHLQKLDGPPKGSLFFGNVHDAVDLPPDEFFQFFAKNHRKYFPIYKLWFLIETACVILTPEDCELILSQPIHAQKSRLYTLLENWMGTGLLTSSGQKWQHRRKILTPTFHFSILSKYVAVFNEETRILVDTLKQHCGKPFTEITEKVTHFTLKTIGETAMGNKFTFHTAAEKQYKKAINEMGQILVFKLLRPWIMYPGLSISYFLHSEFYKERKLTGILHKFTKWVIAERQKNFQGTEQLMNDFEDSEGAVYKKSKRLAMLDLMLAEKENGTIDDAGIQEEVDTFMFEGHDTTAVALSYALMLLACNKDCQEKILSEMVEILGDIHKKPSYNELQKLKYMGRCIKEVLRMYPSVHYISRKLGGDITTSRGELLPEGCIAHIFIYDIHHNPRIYPDPEKFDPDRFLPENIQKRHPYAYLPFSAGPRNCIGQKFALLEMKAALCGVLSNFILEPVDTPESIVLMADIVLRTKYPIKVKLLPR